MADAISKAMGNSFTSEQNTHEQDSKDSEPLDGQTDLNCSSWERRFASTPAAFIAAWPAGVVCER
jgi:hypothetical protein